IQCIGIVLGESEILDEILVRKLQPQRGFDRQMKPPCCDDRRGSEEDAQESHDQVLFIALGSDTPGGHESRWEKKREKRLWPRSEKRGAPEHDAADYEHQENVIHGRARTIERDHSRAPSSGP